MHTPPKAKRRSVSEVLAEAGPIAAFVRQQRKELGYTQDELAQRSGLSLKFIKDLELGKPTVKLKFVNQALAFFGHEVAPRPLAQPRELP